MRPEKKVRYKSVVYRNHKIEMIGDVYTVFNKQFMKLQLAIEFINEKIKEEHGKGSV